MKLKLLLGALVFTAVTANAQVATLNENFNSFTPGQGQTVFPQQQWTAIYPAAQGNPAPMMNIIAVNASDNLMQAYTGGNTGTSQYLISPQIVAPAGDKTLTFKARRGTGSAPGTLQIGLASNPSDMSTFVALNTATFLSSETFTTYTVPVTASSSQYIVFKFASAVAPHTVLEIDDVVYTTPPLGTINENFNTFTTGQGQTVFPQKQWTAIYPPAQGNPAPMMNIAAVNSSDNLMQAYTGGNTGTSQYLISPQIVAPAGDKTLSFKARRGTGSAPGSLQIGLASDPTDMSTFVALNTATFLTSESFTTYNVPVTASTSQYIVFKFASTVAPHTVMELDDVIYDLAANLSVSDNAKNNDAIKFAVNAENTALQFVGKESPKSVEIYSALGARVASGTVDYNRFNISTLQTGVYYILIQTKDGKTVKSKFIKK